jgi:hypothetical protein
VERSAGRFLAAFRGRTTSGIGGGEASPAEDVEPPPSLPAPITARRVACAVDDSLRFAEFLQSRQKRPGVGGPGRAAAPVKRRLIHGQATNALRGGLTTRLQAAVAAVPWNDSH